MGYFRELKNVFFQKMLLKSFYFFLAETQGKKAHQRFYENLLSISFKGLHVGSGEDVEASGELNLLNLIKEKYNSFHKPLIVFDVGANLGKYAINLKKLFADSKDLKIYSFEPSKSTFEQLILNIKDYPNIKAVNCGLGIENATMNFYSDKEHSGLASLFPRKLDHFNINLEKKEDVKIRKLDEFCVENKIEYINFLKLDVEGNELNVLQGAKDMIDLDKIDCIQFEFGGSNIDSKTYFQNFFYSLKEKYNIYRIVKDGLYMLNNYHETQELFLTTNYLAVHKSITDIHI